MMWLGVCSLIIGILIISGVGGVTATEEIKPIFGLPLEGDPGPDTWLLLQPYGNTTFAYRFRYSTYGAGQGLHFGIDLAAPCGTPILAIGDGIVDSVDSWHGAGPHNLMIDHGNGYASFYGHFLIRSHMRAGQEVNRGDIVGVVGDPDLTCSSRPHLHLEIRSDDHRTAYNPLALIDADWERIALLGGGPQSFELDMGHPQQWQGLLSQPDVRFGYPLLNEYDDAWPPDW
jgi:hypothetical protein